MKLTKSIPFKNLTGKPLRTFGLVFLTALLSFTILAGTILITSLEKGLDSLKARLGADIMVVPYEAATKSDLENIVIQGNTGYFYMDRSIADKVASREGIGEISEQFYLASTSSSCCSVPVEIIGFDPETDFTITPWIKKSYSSDLKEGEVVVGNDLNSFVGDTLYFYGVECTVAAKLDKTGTSYDTAVFTNKDTIKSLIRSSVDLKMNTFDNVDPDRTVSCLLINAADGYSPEEVKNDINIHVKKVKAVQTKEMISGISESLSGISGVIGILVTAVWALGLVILLISFTMSVNERKKEFAVLRIMGASRGRLAGIVLSEALLTCIPGGLVGTGIALSVILPFNALIEKTLALPFLLPSAGQIAAYCAAALVISALTCAAAAAVCAIRISRIDTGLILRGDN
ncbi:MAG: FtsX-like permease family protein [Ruminococcus sp.]|nr:FtsX-like permease family protein [Ruminococcus sp.]